MIDDTESRERLQDATDTMRAYRPLDGLGDRALDEDQTQQIPLPHFG